MAQIKFTYAENARRIQFYPELTTRLTFHVQNMIFHWIVNAEGVDLKLHSANISHATPVLKYISVNKLELRSKLEESIAKATLHKQSRGSNITATLKTDGDITLNSSVSSKASNIGMNLITSSVNTVKMRLLTLGDIDPFTLGEIDENDIIMGVVVE